MRPSFFHEFGERLHIYLPLGICFDFSFSSISDVTVLVLGAGISGLNAARTLAEGGVKVKVIEGSDRLCGRVKQGQIGGIWVEIGASTLYGDNIKNPILALAKEVDLKYVTADFEDYIFKNATGYDVTDEADALYEDQMNEVLEKLEQLKVQRK